MMLSSLLFTLVVAASNPNLANVKSVYFLPMGAGLDQYLAIRLTEKQLFRVVTDPSQADAIFTDRIGEGFEERLDELFPDESKKAKAAPGSESNQDKNDWALQKPRSVSFSRGKGTIFLVDRKTREVLWSLYSPSKTNRVPDLNSNATSIAKKIEESLKPKPVK